VTRNVWLLLRLAGANPQHLAQHWWDVQPRAVHDISHLIFSGTSATSHATWTVRTLSTTFEQYYSDHKPHAMHMTLTHCVHAATGTAAVV
jgi:hypothetical protein